MVAQQFAGSGRPLNTHIKDEEHVKGGSSHNETMYYCYFNRLNKKNALL